MTTRSNKPRPGGAGIVETEIERAREEGNWKRVLELADQWRQRPDRQYEMLANFLIGEAKLEDFLEEYPPKEMNCSKAKEGLQEAKEVLTKTIGDEAKKLGVHLDSYILLGKLNYAMGNYSEALRFYERAQLDNLEEKQLPARSLKIMAEAFAIKALCFEKVSANKSKAKIAERESIIISSYELAGDLTILFLQTVDKASHVGQSTWSVTSTSASSSSPVPPPSYSTHKLGPILEMALLKAPALNFKAGNKMRGINQFRAMLQAEESDSTREIRRNVCCKLAEALLHGLSDVQYSPPGTEIMRSTSTTLKHSINTDSPWKPRKHDGPHLYTPKNRLEEIILLVSLCEYMARKEAILNQAPEFFEMRSTKFRDAIIAYDLMAITLSRIRNFRLLNEMLEHSMKFSCNEPHTWTQFGFSLSADGKYHRSLLVFRELSAKNEANTGACLCAARLCYEKLNLYEEGLQWSERGRKKDESTNNHPLEARCHIFIGIGYMLQCKNIEVHSERDALLAKAETHFKKANFSDSGDHLTEYYLAYYHAHRRNISQAAAHVRKALSLHPEHIASLHLMGLILSAQKNYREALEVIDSALDEYSDNLSLMALKVRLEELVNGGEAAVKALKGMLETWQHFCDTASNSGEDSGITELVLPLSLQGVEGSSYGINGTNVPSTSGINMPGVSGSYDHLNGGSFGVGRATGTAVSASGFDAMSDKDSVSLHAHSVTASHVEKTLSEVASSLSSPFPTPIPSDPNYTQMRIWLLGAELHIRQENLAEAERCIFEARNLSPLSYHLMFLRGLLHESRGELEAARIWFENSLGINPTHVASLHHLGRVNHLLGFHHLAEQSLKIAIRIDNMNEELWSVLGDVEKAIAEESLAVVSDSSEHSGTRCLEETEQTPTEVTTNTILEEAKRIFKHSAKRQAIALSLLKTSPVLPFSTIPLSFE